MSNFQEAELEIKLNSQHYDFVQTEKEEEDKIVLQQFNDDRNLVYLSLAGMQVFVPLKDLKVAVDALNENCESSLKSEIEQLKLELEKQKLMTEMRKQDEIMSNINKKG